MCDQYALNNLADDDLLERLKTLVAKNNRLCAVMLAHIGEVDRRQLYLGRGCSSMHRYCMEALNFSESTAFKRITVARAAREYPMIFELVASGAIHLSGLKELVSVLTPENHRELLEQASGKSRRAIEEIVRAHAPKPDAPQMLRKLPSAPAPSLFSAAVKAAIPSVPISTPKAPPVAPLSEDRFKLQVTVSRALKEKIDTAKALLRHQIPDGDLEKVLGKAIDELLATLMRKKFAATKNPRPQPAPSEKRTRYTQAATKRALTERDDLQCAFVSADGRRCTETGFLEIDHKVPYAKGGSNKLENRRFLCKAHNGYCAVLEYGKDHMLKKKRSRAVPKTSPLQTQLFPRATQS